MVRGTLIALFVLGASTAHAQSLELHLPNCTPSHLDVALLRELVLIELGDRSWQLTLGSGLCDAAPASLEVVVVDPSTGARATEWVPVAVDEDPQAAARAAALAIAERAPHMTFVVPPPPRAPTSDRGASLASPDPPPSDEAPLTPYTPLAFGVGLVGRIAPVLPSWALGLRVELTASFDRTWSLRAELLSTWTRATASEGDVDAVVLAGAVALGASVFHDATFDVVLAGRVEGGTLVGLGWTAAALASSPSVHPWLTAGAEIDGVAWLSRDVALVVDLGLAAILQGTRLSTWPSGTQIDFSYFLIDLGAGIRVPL